MNSANQSTASLLSTPSQKHSSLPMKKKYEQASGKLLSSFGFGGPVVPLPTILPTPSRQPGQQRKAPVAARDSKQSMKQSQPAACLASRSQKNLEVANGSLTSTYGFGGGLPMSTPQKM